MNQGYAAGQDATAKAHREATLNERLNRVQDQLISQCDDIERVLARINGTPMRESGPNPLGEMSNKIQPIRATSPMTQVVEGLEGVAQRLRDLRIGVEKVA